VISVIENSLVLRCTVLNFHKTYHFGDSGHRGASDRLVKRERGGALGTAEGGASSMSRKTLKRINDPNSNRKYVLGDVLGEGTSCAGTRVSVRARTARTARAGSAAPPRCPNLVQEKGALSWVCRRSDASSPRSCWPAGAFGQVREGMRVDETAGAGEFGKRVAVKIISRRLIKKVRVLYA
jgi:hypothetical protein